MRHAPSRPCAVCGTPVWLAGWPSRPLDILPPDLPTLTLISNRRLLKYLHTVSKFGFCIFNLDICLNIFIWKMSGKCSPNGPYSVGRLAVYMRLAFSLHFTLILPPLGM